MNHALRLVLALLFAAAPLTIGDTSSHAEPLIDDVGVRVGGYGFREATDAELGQGTGETGWDACRMDGLGVFAHRDYSRHIFFEGALDTYFTQTSPEAAMSTYETPIDRVSGIASVAAGARFFPDAIITPYFQIGIGAELTRARLPELGLEDTAILPMGFFGVGAALNLGSRVSVGAAMRVNAMGYYDDAQFQTEMKPKAEFSTQGQIFAKFAL